MSCKTSLVYRYRVAHGNQVGSTQLYHYCMWITSLSIPDIMIYTEIGAYVKNDPTVFSTGVRAVYQSIPGSQFGGVLVTWQLTYPACIMFLCVKIEIDESPAETISNNCLQDVTIPHLILEEGYHAILQS